MNRLNFILGALVGVLVLVAVMQHKKVNQYRAEADKNWEFALKMASRAKVIDKHTHDHNDHKPLPKPFRVVCFKEGQVISNKIEKYPFRMNFGHPRKDALTVDSCIVGKEVDK